MRRKALRAARANRVFGTDEKRTAPKTRLCNYPATIVSNARMLSTGSLKDAQLLPSSDSNVFSLVAASGRAMDKTPNGLG
jgi:hypothetical protein